MITELTVAAPSDLVTTGLGPLVLPILDSENSIFQVTNIEGLGPVSSSLSSSPYGDRAGAQPTGGHIGERNIVLSIRLNPNWAVQTLSELRHTLYSYFRPQSAIDLTFVSDNHPTVTISGFVESMEPEMFSKEPDIQISILCFSPFFEGPTESFTGFFNTLAGVVTTDITLTGTESVGCVVTIEKGQLSSFTGEAKFTSNYVTSLYTQLNPITISSTHKYKISSLLGDRYVRDELWSTGPDVYLSSTNKSYVSSGPRWQMLVPGVNSFAFIADQAGLKWTLEFNNLYGGL